MSIRNNIVMGALACVLSAPAFASDAGAFIGGVFATKLMTNVRAQTQAEQVQAAAAVQQSQASAPKSAQQRLQELDNLKAQGLITQGEYNTKKKAILDDL